MRLLTLTTLIAALGGGLCSPALALDVEIIAPPKTAAAPAQTAVSDAVETGSIDQKGTPVTSGEPGIGRGIRDILEAETAAVEAATPAVVPEGTPRPSKSPEERDRDALQAFYESRSDEPIWVSKAGLNAKAVATIAEIKRAGDWGLEPGDFELPALKAETDSGAEPSRDDLVKAEMTLSLAVLQYHRYARGGVIPDPAKQLSSYLDRKPRLRDRKVLLEDIAKSDDPAAILVGLHPKHPEFERLRQAWLAARGGGKPGPRNRAAKTNSDQLLANMQQWRWLPEDLGNFYVWVNIPEYLIRIVKDGEVIFTERITAGLVNKQTPIFSDEMERVTFKSRWRVPDSIKVREVWPSLLRGGGMMRQHGLIMTRNDQDVDWRKIDWSKADMNDYVLWQPPGPKNQLGVVKFSFPSKHYVFMHDTPDKHMFAWSRRANSHGCMRIRNPLQMATIILGKDKGLDRAKIDDLVKNGPDHNVIELDQKIPVHITYLTTRIDDAGKVQSFADIYGHEKRVRQALAGHWDKIATGPDHLAPLDQTKIPRVVASTANKNRALRQPRTLTELMFGGN